MQGIWIFIPHTHSNKHQIQNLPSSHKRVWWSSDKFIHDPFQSIGQHLRPKFYIPYQKKNLYTFPISLMGLKSLILLAFSLLRINTINDALRVFTNLLYLWNSSKTTNTSDSTTLQNCWKKSMVNPSRPGALSPWKSFTTWIVSHFSIGFLSTLYLASPIVAKLSPQPLASIALFLHTRTHKIEPYDPLPPQNQPTHLQQPQMVVSSTPMTNHSIKLQPFNSNLNFMA